MEQLGVDALLESLDNLLEYRLVENVFLATHNAFHVTSCEQFATLQADAVSTSVEDIDP